MSFNVVVVGAGTSVFGEELDARLAQTNWNVVDGLSSIDAEQVDPEVDVCAHFLAGSRPSIVICDLSDSSKDNSDERLFASLLPYCSKKQVPVIFLSSFEALGDLDPLAEYADSALISSKSEHDENRLAFWEQKVGELPRHIILRRSWLLDGDRGVLASLVPSLLAKQELVVSQQHCARPVTNAFLASAVFAVAQQVISGAENWGLYHVQSADICSEAEFVDHIRRQVVKSTELEINEALIAERGSQARLFAGAANLSGRKLTYDFGIQLPTWRKGLGAFVYSILEKKGFTLEESEA